MEIEFLQGENALNFAGRSLKEGEAFVFIDNKQVKQELIDRFDLNGYYVGERATGITGKLVVNLYQISVDLIDKFNDLVQGIRFTDLDDKDSYIDFALIPSVVYEFDGTKREDWYISERLNDEKYCRPSKNYKSKMQKENKKWGEEEINNDQAN